jgi:hypothetical protein
MTPFALDLYVAPFKLKVRCYAVIKDLLVEPNDVELPSFMFRMTVLAFGRLDVFAAPVIAETLIDVFCDLFVAIQTQLLLRFFAEKFVTTFAFPFILRMALDDFAGHDDALHVCRSKICGCQHQDHGTYSPNKLIENSTPYSHLFHLRTCARL